MKTNQPSNQRQLIDEANRNLALNNWEQLISKAKNACKQITENNNLAKPTILAKAKASWEAIDQTITITANIASGIRWSPYLAKGLD